MGFQSVCLQQPCALSGSAGGSPKHKLGDDVEDGEALGRGAILGDQQGGAQQHDAGRADGPHPAPDRVAYGAKQAHPQDDACPGALNAQRSATPPHEGRSCWSLTWRHACAPDYDDSTALL